MKLTLVRHGETKENAANIIMGQMPGELTPLGIEQAKKTADELSNEEFDYIYSSDLKRCLDTADAIIKFHSDTPFIITKKLRERYSGTYQGKVFDQEYWDTLPGTNTTRKYEGGESWEDVKNRMPALLNELYDKHRDQSVLLVAHGGVIKGIISLLTNTPLDQIRHEDISNGVIINLEMNGPLL